jgi:hypothetical protein
MRDKILLILENDLADGCTKTLGQIADEIYLLFEERIKLQVDINDRLLLEVRNMYPKEFVEWLLKSEYFYGQLCEEILTPIIDLPDFKTIDELFNYWQTNIKDK